MSRGESAAVKRLIKSILGAPTHYEVLGVDEDASADEIGREYRDLARTVHPDKGGDAAAFKRLANAKEVLCDQNARMAYDLELREAREPAPAPKKKPAAAKAKAKAKPAATKKAPAAKAKKAPAPAEPAARKEPAPKKEPAAKTPAAKRASPPADASPPEQPPKRARAAAPEPEPERAPMPYKGPCTCAIKATERYPITATARLLKCPAGDTDRHGCACPELRQTLQGTAPCRFGGDHACVCATKAASMFVAGKSTRVCRAAVHECSCLFDGQALCKAATHACTCVEDGVAKCRAKKHACSCASSKDPASCLATGKHACACDALCDTFFGKQSSCRARAHACVCPKAGPGACRADDGHRCCCAFLEKTSGGLFTAASTATCKSTSHACICEPSLRPVPHTYATNPLCRAAIARGRARLASGASFPAPTTHQSLQAFRDQARRELEAARDQARRDLAAAREQARRDLESSLRGAFFEDDQGDDDDYFEDDEDDGDY